LKIIIIQEEDMLKEKVEAVLSKVKPLLQRDGGDVELVDVQPDGVVKVRLTGACSGCPMSTLTLKNAIEETIKKEIPEIKSVVQVG
jgi:Fe-S cluster biogenesis protein NfuA